MRIQRWRRPSLNGRSGGVSLTEVTEAVSISASVWSLAGAEVIQIGARVWCGTNSKLTHWQVTDAKLAQHLSHWGINMMVMEKTEMSVTEMNIQVSWCS